MARDQLSFAILALVGFANAAFPTLLQPTSNWNVDYDVAQCTAGRNYGSEEQPLFLVLKPSPFGGTMRVLVAANGGFSAPARALPGSIQFDDEPPIRTSTLKFSSEDKKVTVYSANVPMEQFKSRQSVRSISVKSTDLNRTFALNSLAPVLAELEKCRADLLDMFNVDTRMRVGAKPVKPLQEIYSWMDYPPAAMQDRDEGLVKITLLIDEKGKVADCTVDSSAGAATLDTMSCYVIQQRASFTPAIGLDGRPVRSIYVQSIRWRLRF